MTISIAHMCNNKSEWREPERFIPERFDPKSEWALTPSGNKRNPFSYAPYLGGSRICLGKSFVESVGKVLLPSLLH
jgi:cytochrome P450